MISQTQLGSLLAPRGCTPVVVEGPPNMRLVLVHAVQLDIARLQAQAASQIVQPGCKALLERFAHARPLQEASLTTTALRTLPKLLT